MRVAERFLGATSRLLLGTAWIFVVGCALRITPAPIEPHLSAVPNRGSPGRLVLGVGVFLDGRPPEARLEVHPPLRPLWIGLVRRGEVLTGDASFVGEVAAGVRRDAIATLARSGAFSAVRPVEVDDPAAPARQRLPDVDLVLTATIEEFRALQQQNSTLSLLRVGWLRNRFEDSIGFAKIRYRLYDDSGLLHEYEIQAEHVSAGQPITRAALDAMAVTNETLARRLFADLDQRKEAEHAIVPLRVLDACDLGRERVLALMRDAGEVYGREFGLGFRVEYRSWRKPISAAAAEAVLSELRKNVPAADGAVLALVPNRRSLAPAFVDQPFGLADPFGQHAVVGCAPGGEPPVVTLIHELGHLFGAVHVRDRSSVMHDAMEFDGRFFDPLNRRILLATRARPFGAPLPEEIDRRVRAIYEAASRFPECCEPESLEAALAALAKR